MHVFAFCALILPASRDDIFELCHLLHLKNFSEPAISRVQIEVFSFAKVRVIGHAWCRLQCFGEDRPREQPQRRNCSDHQNRERNNKQYDTTPTPLLHVFVVCRDTACSLCFILKPVLIKRKDITYSITRVQRPAIYYRVY